MKNLNELYPLPFQKGEPASKQPSPSSPTKTAKLAADRLPTRLELQELIVNRDQLNRRMFRIPKEEPLF